MRFLFKAILAFSALVVIGCEPDSLCYPSGQLGSCCNKNSDCGYLVCLQSFPGGYCSRDCGEDHKCPEGGFCLVFESANNQQPNTICLMGCASGQPPCRNGYTCRLVDEIKSPVCVPG